jgi:hypothetical protein
LVSRGFVGDGGFLSARNREGSIPYDAVRSQRFAAPRRVVRTLDEREALLRRQTNTINWSKDLPLAQGLEFG